jgi:hypothetical protein
MYGTGRKLRASHRPNPEEASPLIEWAYRPKL